MATTSHTFSSSASKDVGQSELPRRRWDVRGRAVPVVRCHQLSLQNWTGSSLQVLDLLNDLTRKFDDIQYSFWFNVWDNC